MNLSLFFWIGCRKFLWSQFFITFELKFKHPSSYFDKLFSMLIIWMQAPLDSTLTESQCRSECIHHYRQLSSCISDVIWLLQAKAVAVTVCAEQLQKCHAPAPHSPVNKELSLLFLFLTKHKPTDPLLCAGTAASTSELFPGITGDNSHNTPVFLRTDDLSLSSNLNEEKLPCLHLYE